MSNTIDIDPFADMDDPVPSSPPPTTPPTHPDPPFDELLTADEKKKALDAWNNGEEDLLAIIRAALGPEYTGRHKKGILIKQYLASLKIKARPSQDYKKKSDSFTLTEAHQDFIRSHAIQNKPLEIARELFNNPNLSNLSTEAKAVVAFYNSLDPKLRYIKTNEGDELKEYRPPQTHDQALARVNRYVFEGIDAATISQRQKQCLTALIKYTHVHRYVYTMNEFSSTRDRELFESSFIRFCYDKPDITEEEIDLYINLCNDIVNFTRMQRELEVLIETRDSILEQTGKLPMSIVEEIGTVRKEMGENQKRQKTIYESLQGKRSDRMKHRLKENASVIQLVEAWKNETTRKQLIDIAETRKAVLNEEVKKLSTMDDIRFQLWGMGREEIVNY